MVRFVMRRALFAVPVMLVVTVLSFVLTAFVPGDAARTILGPDATDEEYARLRSEMRLDDPLVVRYIVWLGALLRGDLGRSLLNNQPVVDALNQRLPVTLSLIVVAALVTAIIGVAFGIASAVKGGALGRGLDMLASFGQAVPDYWLALLLVIVFAVNLGLFPATGWVPPGESVSRWAERLVLPVVALAAGGITGIAKQTRDSMLSVLASEYILSLRAVGVPMSSIIFRHALRNAAMPVLTVMGMIFVGAVGGTVLIERVFALPGLGGLAVSSTLYGDIPVVQGLVVYFTAIVLVVNLLVDIAYGLLNPKVRVR
ncbi:MULTISPECIES: ABC transporter permease [unclassified Salinibacterium]|uniref:ABC transporter permease n=1 Tax=Salinibacterium sp. GXW1014 TaxID=3377838 RepID=UPI0019FEC8E0|nr:ABC transporter permease [Salinibacterium sp.]MBF0672411.1 ABC transporter permease [Salinibacterium sp.]